MIQTSLQLKAKKTLQWTTNTIPPLKEDEILIKTLAGAISIGAELPQYNENDPTEPFPSYPKETGYESFGEVVAIGEAVEGFKIGDRAVAFFGHKDYGIVKESKAIFVPKGIGHQAALLVILSCDAAKGVRKLNPKENNRVLVTGSGTMGLLTVYYLKEYLNVRQIDMLEPHHARGEIARKLGVKTVFENPSDCPADFYDYGLECSGFNHAFKTLQQALKHEGEMCILSDGNKESFQLQPDFYRKELRIVGSSDGWDYKQHAKWYFGQMKEQDSGLRELFEKTIHFEELPECFEELATGSSSPIKVLVNYC
ncbi:alcohol dehydrogenase catalytic domain-containing protein [Rossellomorea aquimaris]|uniref:alcohol dehydrogenase catalytic domain-containing protein n=1 Tax=Rossellomorea aquimaris TaxID=189382 RepID=UPI001CD55BAA|nr:zinc-binding alcohol dehydrogenase [Rossellomorea aquimaris]MCA1059582.1 alcohol dehydrogenase catalytic domain-containing protein [Rossellomorea aquimaris]